MPRVLLVCSVHREAGNATAGNLCWLLGRLQPDVIFLEHSPNNHLAFLDGTCGTLESAAVVHYLKAHSPELVPVDLDLQVEGWRHWCDELFDGVEAASAPFASLVLASRLHTERGGFAYLNSPIGAFLESEKHRVMKDTVEALSQPRLRELYALWTSTHDKREMAMLNGVEAFARQAAFEKGVLLVGAAHRHSLMAKSLLPRGDGPSVANWEFDWDLDETPHEPDAGSEGDTPT